MMIFCSSIRPEELPPSGIVPRTAAQRERDIQRYAERQRQEENIRQEARMKQQGALKSKRRLENELARSKLDVERQNGNDQQQEKGHVHPDKDQNAMTSSIAIPSVSPSPLVSPLSSPKKSPSSGKHDVQNHYMVSPSTVSTADMTNPESSFEDGSTGEMGETSSGNDMHKKLPQDVNPQEHSFQRNKKRFSKLKRHVESLTNDVDEFAQQDEQWQERLLELTMNFYVLEEEMEKKIDEIDDLTRYKRLQQEKLETLEKEVKELMACAVKKDNTSPSEEVREKEVRFAHVSDEEETTVEEKYEGKQSLITETIGKIQQQKDQGSTLKLSKMKGLEEFIYQFSCGECRRARYVVSAATTESLKKTALEIIEQSARVAVGTGRNNAAVLDSTSTEQQFVHHLASHVPATAANSEADALLYCKRIIKAEKLKRRRKAVE